MSTPVLTKAGAQKPPDVEERHDILPTLFGEGQGLYPQRKDTFVYSFILHMVAAGLLIWSGHWAFEHKDEIKQQMVGLVTDVSAYLPLPVSKTRAGGGGGGGDGDKLKAPKGALPKLSKDQIVPPAIVVRNENPKLVVEPTVVVPPEIKLPTVGSLGDPLSKVIGAPSNGTGVGGGVSAPKALYAPDPEYSEEARKAKYQGTVVLWLVVDANGRPQQIRIQRALGMGLDEKAIEAVKLWKFDPARKDGQAVPVMINVEVNFRLY